MADSFIQNIRKIRGAAVYGKDMREAIAQAITQAIGLDITGGGLVFFNLDPIEKSDNDFVLNIQNEQL